MNDEDTLMDRRINAACEAYNNLWTLHPLSTSRVAMAAAICAALAVEPEFLSAEDSVETRNLMGSLRATW